MSFDLMINSKEFQDFLLQNHAAIPSKFALRNNKARLLNTLTNTVSIELTYYDEYKAHDRIPFIRLFWFNNSNDPQYFSLKTPPKKLTPQEKRERERIRLEKERQEKERQFLACQRAHDEYRNAAVPCKSHQYLSTKGVLAHYGVKIATQTIYEMDANNDKVYRMCKGEMIIPIISLEKQFMGYQRIRPDGTKLLCRDGLKHKGFFPLGGWNSKKTQRVVLCEGYATGATIHESTGLTVFVCFDIGNVQALVMELRAKYPHIEIILATDFDLEKGQAGLITGLLLAQQFNLKFVFPLSVIDGSDWNDLQAQNDQEAVKELFFAQLEEYNTQSIDEAINYYRHFLTEQNLEKLAA